MNDIQQVSLVMKQCSELGFKISLKNFGNGSSSLTYLKSLPLESIKIDKEMVSNLFINEENITFIKGVLGMANAFNHLTVADGVETVQHGMFLLHLGCEIGQGDCISEAMPGNEVSGWFKQYQISSEWQLAKGKGDSEIEYSLLIMAIEHHQVVSAVLEAIKQREPSMIPQNINNHHSCHFGQWLNNEGVEIFGGLTEFNELLKNHEEIHKLCHQASYQMKEYKVEHLDTISEALEEKRGYILNNLHRLGFESNNLTTGHDNGS